MKRIIAPLAFVGLLSGCELDCMISDIVNPLVDLPCDPPSDDGFRCSVGESLVNNGSKAAVAVATNIPSSKPAVVATNIVVGAADPVSYAPQVDFGCEYL